MARRRARELPPSRGVRVRPDPRVRLAAEAAGVYLDYSKNLVTDDTLQLLRRLAHERGLEERIRGLFAAAAARSRNSSGCLRSRSEPGRASGSERPASGSARWSSSGPSSARLVRGARERATPDIAFRFVSSVDPVDLARATEGLDLRETLFVVSTTGGWETLALADGARARIASALGRARGGERHVVAVSADPDAASALLGIPREHVFQSGAGEAGRVRPPGSRRPSPSARRRARAARRLPGDGRALREGALGGNLPAIAGLLGVWYRSFLGAQTAAVEPYPTSLRLLPAYVRQLEALGRRHQESGEPVETDTGAVVWGATGTDAQSAVLPFLHRGTALVPVDLVAVARSPERMHESSTTSSPRA